MSLNAQAAEAKQKGLTRFFSGVPCKKGHLVERLVANTTCVECQRETQKNAKAWRRPNVRARKIKAAKDWTEKHKQDAVWRAENNARLNKYVRARRADPAQKAKELSRRREQPRAQATRARKARIKGLLCDCCTRKDLTLFYALAKALGCEVDHRTPLALNGRHCLKNIQALSREEHKAKTKLDVKAIAAARHAAN